MARAWYVVHTYSGHENKVQKHLLKLMGDKVFGDAVTDVKVPSEDVVEIKDGKKKITSKRFLPGYVLVEMDLPEDAVVWKPVCTTIRHVSGVTGFVGASRDQKPQPISQEEARTILAKTGEIRADKVLKPKQSFSSGEQVRIIDGPFESFTGNIEDVNLEKGKLRVLVGIFGRSTPVEVDLLQVEKI
jgi:transcriptional antiterminator NusG